MNTLETELHDLIAAAFSGIYIRSHEHDDAIATVGKLTTEHGWKFATWDIERGLGLQGGAGDNNPDPMAAIHALGEIKTEGAFLLVLRNFHRLLDAPEIIQAVDKAISEGKHNRTFIVILAPVIKLPVELEKQFVVVEHQLPTREELSEILKGVAQPDEIPTDPTNLIDATAGLTRNEAENAFSLSLVKHGKVKPEVIWDIKSSTLKKSGQLTLHKGGEKFSQLGGLDALKDFCLRALKSKSKTAMAKGVLLLGPAGVGKSAFAKALGNEVERPTISLDVGALKGSLVGQTEQNTRQAIAQIDAMAPCIVFLDELDKSLAGAQSSGQTDSGVAADQFKVLLQWLNDHETRVFTVATANDITKLPPEFARMERWDGIYFLDLPGKQQKDIIWNIYTKVYQLDGTFSRPDDTEWTGAEIKSCCRLAALLGTDLMYASKNVIPVATTAKEKVVALREWAEGRCLSSEVQDVYTMGNYPPAPASNPTRNIKRGMKV